MDAIEKFRQILENAIDEGKSLNQIAVNSGADGPSLHKWLKGKQKNLNFLTVSKVMGYLGADIVSTQHKGTIKRLGENSPELPSEGEGMLPVKVYAVAGAGPAWDLREADPIFSISAPPAFVRQSSFALLIDGESMYPTIKNGAVVGVSDDRSFRQNEIFAVQIPYEGLAVKRVAIDHSSNEYVLRSDNPDKSKYDDIRLHVEEAANLLVGRVVWVWQGV